MTGTDPYSFAFNKSMVCDKLDTLATGTYSMAPADAFATESVKPTALRFGMMTPWTPAPSADRRIAPKLCGSSIPSRRRRKGSSLFSGAIQQIFHLIITVGRHIGNHSLMVPPPDPPAAILSSVALSTNCMEIFLSLARASIFLAEPSAPFASTVSIPAAFQRSITGFRPTTNRSIAFPSLQYPFVFGETVSKAVLRYRFALDTNFQAGCSSRLMKYLSAGKQHLFS